jgi:isopentenyldiphosphate isomerase
LGCRRHHPVRCRLDGFEGDLRLDDDEVQATQWKMLSELCKEVQDEPDRFTSWLRAEFEMLKDVLMRSEA